MESSSRIGWTTATSSYDYHFTKELEVLEDFDIYGSGPTRTYRKVEIVGRYVDVEGQISRYFSGLGGFQEEDPRDLKRDFIERQAKFRAANEADRAEFDAVINSNDLESKKLYYATIRFSGSIYVEKIKNHIAEFEEKLKLEKLTADLSELPPVPDVVSFFRMKGYKHGHYVRHDSEPDWCDRFNVEFAGIGWTNLTAGSHGAHLNGGVRVSMCDYVEFISLEDRQANLALDRPYTLYTRYIGPYIDPEMMKSVQAKKFFLKDMYYCFVEDNLYWCFVNQYNLFSKTFSTKEFLIFGLDGTPVKGNSAKYKMIVAEFKKQRFSGSKDTDTIVFSSIVDEFKDTYKKELSPWLEKFWTVKT